MKKILFVLLAFLMICGPVNAGAQENMQMDLNTAYYLILEEYQAAMIGMDTNINQSRNWTESFGDIYFALLDIDENGIQELFIADGSGEVVDAFTYNDGNAIRLLTGDMGYRIDGYLCEEGLMKVLSSSGAAYSEIAFYRIREDGKSCEMVELYDMDTNKGQTELVDGSIIPCGPDDYYKYNALHGNKIVAWINLSEENIQANIVVPERIDVNWSERDIIQAPIFRMGVCDNYWELLETYYLRQLKDVDEADIRFNWSNHYYSNANYNTDIQFVEITNGYGFLPYYYITLNTKTGEVKETKGDGSYTTSFNLIDTDLIPAPEVEWYQPCSLSEKELYQKYADLVAWSEEQHGAMSISAPGQGRSQINGVAYLELEDFDSDGTEELLIVYNSRFSATEADYKFEIWGGSGNEIVMKDTGPLYTTDGGIQTLKLCTLNGKPCVLSGFGGDFSFEFYHGYDGEGISIISTMYRQEGYSGYVYSIDGNIISEAPWEMEQDKRDVDANNYTLNGTDDTYKITEKIAEIKNILRESIDDNNQMGDGSGSDYSDRMTPLTSEQAEEGLSNYLSAYYPTGRHYPTDEQSPGKYSVWAIYPTAAQEILTVDLTTGDVYAEGPYWGGGMTDDNFPVATRYLINVYDYLN